MELTDEKIIAIRDANLLQIKFAREYILTLLDPTEGIDWFVIPNNCHTNLAWQIGHLTVSQYGLLLFRQRGRAEHDLELMPSWFRKKFARGSDPNVITPELISQSDLIQSFNAVYDEAMQLGPTLAIETLRRPIEMPYVGYANNLGAIMFCPLHEMIHAGQIGALRRAHGLVPVR